MKRLALLTASLPIFAALALGACTTMAPDDAPGASATIAGSLADTRRPAADVARDEARKPAQMLAFAGVKPGMTVAEVAPGGGYYTRLLAAAVGPQGRVYALMPAAFANRPGGLDGINAIAAAYPNVTVVVADYASLQLPAPADLAWTTENYHDLANGPEGTIPAFLAGIQRNLKPGGLFFIEDHAAPGTGLSATRTLHRIDPAAVKTQLTTAGFVLDAESDLMRNPADDHSLGVQDPAIRGETDKFALRFRRP
jgi:predicted methyltransferase